MKNINNLSESDFLKLLFVFIGIAFIAGALCMPDRSNIPDGLWQIVSQPCKVPTNYFSIGGFAATFFNMGILALIIAGLFHFTGTKVNNVSTLAFMLTTGFGSWGINFVNMWFSMLGVVVVNLIKKEKFYNNINAMLFTTGIAPVITELLVRYPHTDTVGFSITGIALAVITGIFAGIIISCVLPHSPNVHKGYNLYSAALPVGMTMFLINGILYKVTGVEIPGTTSDLSVASASIVNTFCIILFLLFIVIALGMGCSLSDYIKFLKNRSRIPCVSEAFGNSMLLMNAGVYGLFILAYYNVTGASFNGITFGLIFCMLCTCNSGSRPSNVWPLMLGYIVAAEIAGFVSPLLGGSFAMAINSQSIVIGLCYANGLSPICDKYGWFYGFVASIMHYCLVTLVPGLHGGFCLYNGGFTAIFVCIILVPVLESLCKTKEERLSLKVN